MVNCVHNMLITLYKCSLQFTFSTGPQLSVHGAQTYQRRLAHSQSVRSECVHIILMLILIDSWFSIFHSCPEAKTQFTEWFKRPVNRFKVHFGNILWNCKA